MDERWAPIEGCDKYQISSTGRVKGPQKILKQRLNPYGYPFVSFYNNDYKIVTHRIHRLMAKGFIPNPDNKPCVDHEDGDRANNNLSNIRWCDYRQNNVNRICKRRDPSLPTGVYKRKSGKYRVHFKPPGEKVRDLGTYNTLIKAELQRLLAEKLYNGKFMPQSHKVRLKKLLPHVTAILLEQELPPELHHRS